MFLAKAGEHRFAADCRKTSLPERETYGILAG